MAKRWDILSNKLKDVGVVPKERENATNLAEFKLEKEYPSIYSVTDSQLPEMKGKKVGDEIKFVAIGKITSTSIRNGDVTDYTIEVREMSIVDRGGY